jgi:phenylacetaldehyde dehydrogenase
MLEIDKASVAATEQRVAAFLRGPHRLLINGEWTDATSGETIAVYNPANGEEIARVQAANHQDVDRAVAAARKAFDTGPWRKMTPAQRARLIYKLADALEAAADDFALIETLDNGKPLKMARNGDVANSIEKLRYSAGWATKLTGETITPSVPGTWHAYTLREPVGVAGLITPWNFPLFMAVAKIAPALAAGCTVVLKPAEQTPLSALRLGQLVLDVGFPEGVINIVNGEGRITGQALTEHPDVNKISFTGSTTVGKAILDAARGNLKRITLELGGKSPSIVFPDADMEKAISGAARGIFFNTGQVCAAGSRLYVHKKIFDRVIEGVVENAGKLKVGAGVEADTDLGPVVSERQQQRIRMLLQSGLDAGAQAIVGDNAMPNQGYFVSPTILTGTTPDMAVRREEIFGPVLCAMSFDDEDLDRIAAEANDTSYGLAASIWTRDLSTAHKMAGKIQAGYIRINGGGLDDALPFGGYKQSGWGRESGQVGVESFTELKSVLINLD